MRRIFLYLLLFVIIISHSSCEKKTQQIYYDSKYKTEIAKARKEASLYMIMNKVPGASIAVAKKGKIIYSEAMGTASKDLEVTATRKTKFRIGATTEIFTGLMYQMMIEEGILHPDSSIQHYLPDYPETIFNDTVRIITLDNLINHSSGIRQPKSTEKNWRGLMVTLEKSIDEFKNDPLEFVPGMYNSQSAFNYSILGLIMEKATDKRFSQLFQSYILDTLQLSNTEIDNPFRTIIGRTDFYDFNIVAQPVNSSFIDLRHRAPSEGLLSNAEDLIKFANAILYSENISDKVKEQILSISTISEDFQGTISNGWIVQKSMKDEIYYGKYGSIKGGGSIILIIPEQELVLAATVNITADNEIPIFKIMQPFLSEAN